MRVSKRGRTECESERDKSVSVSVIVRVCWRETPVIIGLTGKINEI